MKRLVLMSWLCLLALQGCWRRDEDPSDRDETAGEEIVDDIEDSDKDVDETVDEEVEPSPAPNPVPPPDDVDPVQGQ